MKLLLFVGFAVAASSALAGQKDPAVPADSKLFIEKMDEGLDLITKDGTLIWAMEASDKNFWWGALASEGHRKVAKKVVEGLKDVTDKQ